MKTFTVLASLLLSLAAHAQPGIPIFEIGPQGTIETDASMIEPFYDMPSIDTLPYRLSYGRSLSPGSKFLIATGYFKEMDETDRGTSGFTVIAIFSKGKKIFELRQPEMWTHLYDGQTTMDYRQYTDNRYFIPIPLSEQAVALAFVGWPYDSTPSYLTIIVLTDNDAKLIFNKHMNINTIAQSDDSYVMELQANVVEYDENGKLYDYPNNVPIIHHIEVKDGVMYFK